MPIPIIESPEPLSEASFSADSQLIESDASRLLYQELTRYCRQQVSGRSFLISGHRGAGKTTLVAHAIQQVMRTAEAAALRPLFIPLHGPNLLPNVLPVAAADTAREAADDAGEVTRPADAAREEEIEVRHALEQITLGMHRALAREVVQAYRRRIFERDLGYAPGRRRPDVAPLLELAAALEVELYECPSASRLREFWSRAGLLPHGVLGRGAADQGWRELVALAGVSEAYRRISGTYSRQEKRTDSAATTQELTVGVDAGKELFGPLVSLLVGGLVGVGLRSTGDVGGYAATLSGIGAALGSAAVMKYSGTRSRARTASREATFLFDLSVATLDRVLPILIDRLRSAGLAPVFVVDELDKVQHLEDRIVGMVHHLKKFVAESAFFVFITDRDYFEALHRRSVQAAYPVEHTYFGHQLFIVFRPRDLHRYVREVVRDPRTLVAQAKQAQQAQEEADYPLLEFILLHRAQMHAIDLRREIARLRDPEGNVALRPGLVRSSRAYRFDVRVQLAVEMVLDQDDFHGAMEMDAGFRRLAHDAMYYLSRRWYEDAEAEIDLGDDALREFRAYLVRRMGPVSREHGAAAAPANGRAAGNGAATSDASPAPPAAPDPNEDLVGKSDGTFLLERVRELAALLADHTKFRARFVEWNGKRDDEERVAQAVIDALGEDDLPLLERVAAGEGADRYRWSYYPSGRLREHAAAAVRAAQRAHHAPAGGAAWRGWVDFLRGFERALAELAPAEPAEAGGG